MIVVKLLVARICHNYANYKESMIDEAIKAPERGKENPFSGKDANDVL